jgi:hypothetical protein
MTLVAKTDYRVIPIEAVYIVIEVKSLLSKEELRTSVQSIRKLKSLKKRAYVWDDGQDHVGPLTPATSYIGNKTSIFGEEWAYFPTLGFIFAYESPGLKSVSSNLTDFHVDIDCQFGVDGVWVLKRGVVVHWSDTRSQFLYAGAPESKFKYGSPENPLLLMLVMLQRWCQSAWMPPFDVRQYLQQSSLLRLDQNAQNADRTQRRNPGVFEIPHDAVVDQTRPTTFTVTHVRRELGFE